MGTSVKSIEDGATHGLLRGAVENMVFGCGEAAADARVLIVREAGGEGYYSSELAAAMASAIRSRGPTVALTEVVFRPEVQRLPAALVQRMAAVDLTIFLARIGDQVRFIPMPPGARAIVCYALDAQSLASPFGTAPYQAFIEIKSVLEAALANAEITIRCEAGTGISGRTDGEAEAEQEVTVRRFPMLVPRPVPAAGFAGRVALCGFLTGTGTRYYEPYSVTFAGPLFARFTDGRLTGFDGSADDVARANDHYDRISARFGIDRDFVHSWHAGIHPACTYTGRIADDYLRWGIGAFGNPRVLHFHTCGAYAPGEISWNVIDPTITANGVAIWEKGRLHPERLAGGAAVLARYPEVAALFANPARDIGF